MNTHLSYSDKDLYLVKEIINTWMRKGFIGSLDISNAGSGYIEITTKSWIKNNDNEITLRLHKIYAGSGFFDDKCLWVTQVFTRNSKGEIIKHGCVKGKNQLKALDRGINQVGFGFTSKTKIEDYYFV